MPPLLSVWGFGVVVGAAVSPWLSAGVAPLLTGLVGLVVLGWWSPGALVLRCGALACGLILGLLGHAVLPDPPTVDVPQRVTGQVVHRVGNTVDVDADVGRLRIRLLNRPCGRCGEVRRPRSGSLAACRSK